MSKKVKNNQEPVINNNESTAPGTEEVEGKHKVTVSDEEVDATWDTLYSLSIETNKELVNQSLLVQSLYEYTSKLFTNNGKAEELNSIRDYMVGLYNTFSDITLLLRKNMELHITLENDKIVDYKKGKIDTENEDYFNYFNIANNYIHAQEQIADITAKTYGEIIALVQTYFKPITPEEEANLDYKAIAEKDNITEQEARARIKSLREEYETFIAELNAQRAAGQAEANNMMKGV